MRRRRFVTAVGGAATGAVAGCLGGDGGDSPPAEPEYGDWFGPVDHFEGFADMTDTATVEVAVGNGPQGWRFTPPAVTVAPGTALRFIWTGFGGKHNVQDADGNWENPEGLVETAGHAWERAFDSPGTHLYRCRPHSSLGMRGAVFVDGTID